ncbi:MAG: ElyC/SanA/YdcF family protein, partial [Pseudolabrys sp.]
VTSAMHMPRAVGVFRKAGFEVDAYPVDYLTTGAEELWTLPRALMGGIGITDLVVHEWIGLLAYWITGRISELFPGPISEISLPAGSIYNGSEKFPVEFATQPCEQAVA